MDTEKEFMFIFRNLLDKKNLKQADLCRLTGIESSLMSEYFNGRKSPGLHNAKLIADALGVTLDELSGNKVKEGSYVLNNEEKRLLVKWRQLTRENKYKIWGRIEEKLDESSADAYRAKRKAQ